MLSPCIVALGFLEKERLERNGEYSSVGEGKDVQEAKWLFLNMTLQSIYLATEMSIDCYDEKRNVPSCQQERKWWNEHGRTDNMIASVIFSPRLAIKNVSILLDALALVLEYRNILGVSEGMVL